MPENAGKMQKNNRFQKGQSGNPKGKTKGTKNKVTRLIESLMQNELDSICQKLIELAIGGNIQAIKLVLDRILPPKASRSVEIAIPKKEHEKADESFWTDDDMAFLKKELSEFKLSF